MKKFISFLAIVIIIVALGIASYFAFIKKEKKELTEEIKAQENAVNQTRSKLPVSVMKVKKGDIAQRARISAIAEVWEKSIIKTETRGKVEKINFKVGDYVRRGQILVKLDDEEKKLDLTEKKASKLEKYSKYLIKDRSATVALPELKEEDKAKLAEWEKQYGQAKKDFRT